MLSRKTAIATVCAAGLFGAAALYADFNKKHGTDFKFQLKK